jgi:hypothetical protein
MTRDCIESRVSESTYWECDRLVSKERIRVFPNGLKSLF